MLKGQYVVLMAHFVIAKAQMAQIIRWVVMVPMMEPLQTKVQNLDQIKEVVED